VSPPGGSGPPGGGSGTGGPGSGGGSPGGSGGSPGGSGVSPPGSGSSPPAFTPPTTTTNTPEFELDFGDDDDDRRRRRRVGDFERRFTTAVADPGEVLDAEGEGSVLEEDL
jgi:hypothetical protein